MGNAPTGAHWAFDRFRLLPDKRLFLRDDRPVALASKAFDTLAYLVENRDRVVTKDELLHAIWPDVVVEEGNLTQQIFILRKALGESAQEPRYIATVPGYGYRFTASVNDIPAYEVPASKPRLSNRLIWVVVAATAAALVLGFTFKRRPTPRKGDWTDMAAVRIQKISESGKVTHATLSQDGRYVAYVESDGDENSLWVQRIATGGKGQVVAPQQQELTSLRFSPDGDFLYFTRGARNVGGSVLTRVPSIGGTETPILDDVDTPVSFSPDGRRFVFMRGAGAQTHIVVAETVGGSQRILATRRAPLAFAFAAPAWAPDGNRVAVSTVDQSNGNVASIVVLPITPGTPRELYAREGHIGALRWLHDGSGVLAVISEVPDRITAPWQGRLWRIGYPGGLAERLTSDLADYHRCCVDVDNSGRTVAGLLNTLVSDLWIASVEHLERPRQITSGSAIVGRPSWFPDNDTIVHRDLKGRVTAVNRSGRAFDLALPAGRRIIGSVSACGDGRHVVFQAAPGNNIWRVTAATGEATMITRGSYEESPTCSADGKWVVYTSKTEGVRSVWRVSIDGGQPIPLVSGEASEALPSPGGGLVSYLGYAWDEHPVRLRRLVWVVVSSNDGRRLYTLNVPDNWDRGRLPAWAPDESGIDYVATQNGVSNIWRQPLTGDPPVQITNFNAGIIFSFAWSRDGRWLSLTTGLSRSDAVIMSRN